MMECQGAGNGDLLDRSASQVRYGRRTVEAMAKPVPWVKKERMNHKPKLPKNQLRVHKGCHWPLAAGAGHEVDVTTLAEQPPVAPTDSVLNQLLNHGSFPEAWYDAARSVGRSDGAVPGSRLSGAWSLG